MITKNDNHSFLGIIWLVPMFGKIIEKTTFSMVGYDSKQEDPPKMRPKELASFPMHGPCFLN
jgi:hypothetical protein